MTLHDEIAEAAYEIYETRGRASGREMDDWLEAERIVLARHAGQDMEEPEEEDIAEETQALVPKIKETPDEGTVMEEGWQPSYEEAA